MAPESHTVVSTGGFLQRAECTQYQRHDVAANHPETLPDPETAHKSETDNCRAEGLAVCALDLARADSEFRRGVEDPYRAGFRRYVHGFRLVGQGGDPEAIVRPDQVGDIG